MATTLQDLCAMKVIIEFCLHWEVKEIILSQKLYVQPSEIKYQNVYEYLKEVLLPRFSRSVKRIPYLVRKNLPDYLIPLIGTQMTKWIIYNRCHFNLSHPYSINFLKASHFNSNGALNRKLAVVELVKDERLTTRLRFKIANHYFFTGYIRKLWERLTENEKHHVRRELEKIHNCDDRLFPPTLGAPKDSILIFTDNYKCRDRRNFFLDSCRFSLCTQNDISFKNSFEKLKSSNINYALQVARLLRSPFRSLEHELYRSECSFISWEPTIRMLEYLLCTLSDEQFCNIFRPHLFIRVLKVLLLWPYQYLFMKVAKKFIEYVRNFEFYILLHSIINMVEDQQFSNTFDYRNLFLEFWKLSGSDYKTIVLFQESGDASIYSYMSYSHTPTSDLQTSLLTRIFLLDNFIADDKYLIETILKGASADAKQKIVAQQGHEICQSALSCGKFEIADLFVKYFVPKYLINEFKKNLQDKKRDYIFAQLESKCKMNLAEQVDSWLSGCYIC